jgi:hypothetical protein
MSRTTQGGIGLDETAKQNGPVNYEQQFKGIIQTMSSILIPLILVAGIDTSRLLIAVMPSITAMIFLAYDFYGDYKKKKIAEPMTQQYMVMVKNKVNPDDFATNQLFKDIEYYINEIIMKQGMRSSVVEDVNSEKYIGNNYYSYSFNLKLPEQNTISFKFEENIISITKNVSEVSGVRNTPIKMISVVADDFKIIHKFLKVCQESYYNHVKNLEKVTYHFYRYQTDAKKWISKKIQTTKTSENVILPESLENNIKSWLTEYATSEEKYKRLGIPYKLGLLLHGLPGCGKTSIAYAIANETGRNIYQIPLNVILADDLKSIVDTIPPGNIALFEEIDTCSFFSKREHLEKDKLVKMYEAFKQKEQTSPAQLNSANDNDNEDDDENEDEDEEDELNSKPFQSKKIKVNIPTHSNDTIKQLLENMDATKKEGSSNTAKPEYMLSSFLKNEIAHILEILDGYNYLYDTIVIMYTNHIDKIDPAVIRPGRIDHKIMLGYADLYQVKKLYKLYYDYEISEDIAKKIVDRNVTTSFLINTCIIPSFRDKDKSIELALTENNDL